MKTEIAALWTTALTNGSRKQVMGQLKRDGGFCCLGVLCDLYIEAGVDKSAHWDVHYCFHSNADQEAGILPRQVQLWAGLDTPTGRTHEGASGSLIGLNDNGYSFEFIANFINAHVEKL